MNNTYEDILDVYVGAYYWGDDRDPIPEHLDLIADIDLTEPNYSFDLLRIYVRRHDGALLWATDSGCSCPSPFEDVKVGDLRESTLATLLDTFMADWERGYSGYPEAQVRKSIGAALREARARGAR